MIIKELSLWLGERHGTEVVYVSQYDNMWRFKVSLIYNSQPWQIPTGATAVLNGKKPDGNVFAFSGTIANNTVTVDADVQMTAVAGKTACELSILSDGKVVGTANFILNVEAAPKSPDDVSSESTLPAYGEILDRIEEMWGGGGGGSVTVDDALSGTSENPVQNKVIYSALDGKVDKVSGKGLSTNDFTTTEKSKLAGIQAGAQVNPDLSGYALSANIHNIPSGGAAGQFLVKQSATDYDAAWVTVPNANGVSF